MNGQAGPDPRILHSFSYPVYQLRAVGPNVLLAAGGGGLSKTGVPNRVDIVQINRPAYASRSVIPQEALIPSGATVSFNFYQTKRKN